MKTPLPRFSASTLLRFNASTVYTTGVGRMCPECGKPASDCAGHRKNSRPQGDGIVRISLDTKGRKGKGVTVIAGVPLNQDGLEALAKQLKRQCGAGGTVKDGVIEIQGDHRDGIMGELVKQGYEVKRAGG